MASDARGKRLRLSDVLSSDIKFTSQLPIAVATSLRTIRAYQT